MYSKTKETSKVKDKGRSVCWPKYNIFLETLPKLSLHDTGDDEDMSTLSWSLYPSVQGL